MNFQIHSQDFELTPPVEQYFRQKFSKFEELMSKSAVEPRLDIYAKRISHKVEGDVYSLEISLNFLGKKLFAKERGQDIYALADEVQEEMLGRLRKQKEKPLTLVKKGALKLKRWLRFGSGDSQD